METVVSRRSLWSHRLTIKRGLSIRANRRFCYPYLVGNPGPKYQLPSGFVAVDKPEEWTIEDVLVRIRDTFRKRSASMGSQQLVKCGWPESVEVKHLGFLDQVASGTLIVSINEPETHLADVDNTCEYSCTISLGKGTKTNTWPPKRITSEGYGSDQLVDLPTPEEIIRMYNESWNRFPTASSASHTKALVARRYPGLAKFDNLVSDEISRRVDYDLSSPKLISLEVTDQDQKSIAIEFQTSSPGSVLELAPRIAETMKSVGHVVYLKRLRHGLFSSSDCLQIRDFGEFEAIENLMLEHTYKLRQTNEGRRKHDQDAIRAADREAMTKNEERRKQWKKARFEPARRKMIAIQSTQEKDEKLNSMITLKPQNS
ncbi:hypothetical protein NDN08_001067 [Rhodosorus marinus]|uniref:Uncharacterized protein n=1 Tax=Rhodosorus marinus TaxID=101924 RepID=A0AAV8UPR3_9RHOD|nr:hypothetical protein NDN08_001067 [Rhodosorus marinus]